MSEVITKEDAILYAKKLKEFCLNNQCKYSGCPFDSGDVCMFNSCDPANWWRLEDLKSEGKSGTCDNAEFDADGCYCKKYNHIVTCCGDISRCNKDIYEKAERSDICPLACNICAFNTLNKR